MQKDVGKRLIDSEQIRTVSVWVCPSLSAIKPDYQAFVVFTPNFTPSFGREIGYFGCRLKGRKEGNKNFYSPFCSFQKEGIRLYTHFSFEPYI